MYLNVSIGVCGTSACSINPSTQALTLRPKLRAEKPLGNDKGKKSFSSALRGGEGGIVWLLTFLVRSWDILSSPFLWAQGSKGRRLPSVQSICIDCKICHAFSVPFVQKSRTILQQCMIQQQGGLIIDGRFPLSCHPLFFLDSPYDFYFP